jgi:hypothetical protein
MNTLGEERNCIINDLKSIKTTAELTIRELGNKLDAGVTKSMDEMDKLQTQALELGKELGGYKESIESSRWLLDLLAIVNDNDDIESSQVREILTKITKGMLPWLDRHKTDISISLHIQPHITGLIRGLEWWRI